MSIINSYVRSYKSDRPIPVCECPRNSMVLGTGKWVLYVVFMRHLTSKVMQIYVR